MYVPLVEPHDDGVMEEGERDQFNPRLPADQGLCSRSSLQT